MPITPELYENWYHTPRGQWISDREFALLMKLFNPTAGHSLLDVGCGTGHFTRRFQQAGLNVTGLDPDSAMLEYARHQSGDIEYRKGSAEQLPFDNEQFDYGSAITSLCFVEHPVIALQEMWRVSKYSVVLGLLNRHSLLHRHKAGRGAYTGARWDTRADVINWLKQADITPTRNHFASAIFFPAGGPLARILESLLPNVMLWGGFLAVYLDKRLHNHS